MRRSKFVELASAWMDGEATPAEEAILKRELGRNPGRRKLLESLARLNKAAVRARFPLEEESARATNAFFGSSTMWALSGSAAGIGAAFLFIFASAKLDRDAACDASPALAAVVDGDVATPVQVPVVVDNFNSMDSEGLSFFASLSPKASSKSADLSLLFRPSEFTHAGVESCDCDKLRLDMPGRTLSRPAGAMFINAVPALGYEKR